MSSNKIIFLVLCHITFPFELHKEHKLNREESFGGNWN